MSPTCSNLLDTIDQDWTLVELSANSELLTTSAANTSATGHLMSSRQLLVDQSIDLLRATLTAAEKVEQATTAAMEQLRALDEHLELLRGRPPDTTFEGLCTFDEEDVLDDLRNELTSALTQRTKALVRVVLDHAKQMQKFCVCDSVFFMPLKRNDGKGGQIAAKYKRDKLHQLNDFSSYGSLSLAYETTTFCDPSDAEIVAMPASGIALQ
ncbi:hypothetical protein EDD18DRAFT_1102036 [Armillaria luteobubalina]|uniref:Uncharacterized protein n=1 Tax=Armillaria luteobubalina TaxID=153913 RepID=A0AA39TUP1_9AGAR|nr:hypothetical protein EDD18DRAFT_1102036 [Armillaria luteobubalina]